MKKIIFQIFICSLLLLPIQGKVFARSEVSRTETSTMNLKSLKNVLFDTEYGSLVVNHWDRNEMTVTVHITAKSKNQSDAEYAVNNVSVSLKEVNGVAQYKFKIAQNKKGNTNNLSYEIRYVANIPKSVNVAVNHMYGNVQLPDMTNNVVTDIKYGHLNVGYMTGNTNRMTSRYGNINADGVISGKENKIDIKYGNVAIGDVSGLLTMDMGYGVATMGDVKELKMNSAYSKFQIGDVGKMSLSTKYDTYITGAVRSLNCGAAYSTFKIDEIKDELVIKDLKYGGLSIGKIAAGFSKIDLSGAYININLAFEKPIACEFDLATEYGNINLGPLESYTNHSLNDIKIKKRSGTAGSGKGKLNVVLRYGNLNISQY